MWHEDEPGIGDAAVEGEIIHSAGGQPAFHISCEGVQRDVGQPLLHIAVLAQICRELGRAGGGIIQGPEESGEVRVVVFILIGLLQIDIVVKIRIGGVYITESVGGGISRIMIIHAVEISFIIPGKMVCRPVPTQRFNTCQRTVGSALGKHSYALAGDGRIQAIQAELCRS